MFPLILNLLRDFHIPAIVLFPYSLLVLAHWSFAKDYLMNCNSYLIQFLKTYVTLTMSSLSLICQEGNTCLFKLIMFSSWCLVIAFGILINTNKRIEIMFFFIVSKLLPCLQLRQGETILGSMIPTEDNDCPHVRNI